MKTHISVLILAVLLIALTSCDDDNNNVVNPVEEQFVSLSSPYLICATRNPGGVGFDFEYSGEQGGANNLDSLTVSDFAYDAIIRTVKAEKPDGCLGGMPYIALASNAEAVNYSAVDTTCKGYPAYQNLVESDLLSFTFAKDDSDFNLSDLTKGDTGKPLLNEVKAEFNKLVIGQRWKTSANNETSGDELIWIIKTPENRWVKLIVTDFPANPAPTATGYIALEWGFLK
ncbi:MAG: hypothetical protein P9X24_06850 [Candidatus Hatepunaea meridiana]|nr:hypothetical protein [Candidatus Hatepunaea meridiana]